jgi:arabinose-5-phosphate isomerase
MTPHPTIATLEAAASALQTLAHALADDPALPAAIALLQSCRGRVVVTGVGKSGHIGGKIAATLASTGTPSLFVHPTEALHGDLGMITKDDVIVALSHSGESKELAAILSYAARFGIPLVALTGNPNSTLGRAASITLNTRVVREACPLNLAPTTSTTATLALADGLAVALMQARGFGQEDFANFHPGGKLGAQLLRVYEVMQTEDLPLLPATAAMSDVLVRLTQRNLGCVGATDAAGCLSGIFTDGDLKRRLKPDLLQKKLADVLTPHPKTIGPEALAVQAAAQMAAQHVTCLWVVDAAHHPQGLVRLQDLLNRGVV